MEGYWLEHSNLLLECSKNILMKVASWAKKTSCRCKLHIVAKNCLLRVWGGLNSSLTTISKSLEVKIGKTLLSPECILVSSPCAIKLRESSLQKKLKTAAVWTLRWWAARYIRRILCKDPRTKTMLCLKLILMQKGRPQKCSRSLILHNQLMKLKQTRQIRLNLWSALKRRLCNHRRNKACKFLMSRWKDRESLQTTTKREGKLLGAACIRRSSSQPKLTSSKFPPTRCANCLTLVRLKSQKKVSNEIAWFRRMLIIELQIKKPFKMMTNETLNN